MSCARMGNWISGGILRRRHRPVEARLTRPRRLARQLSDVDYKKLRRLIVDGKLAPCFDALDDRHHDDLEECPICFLYFPSLNRSLCCGKGICTECFLQMKPSDASQAIQCPYCKCECFAVEYHGARTNEEKVLELIEEQKVIEAKLKIQLESQNDKRVIPVEQNSIFSEIECPLSTDGGPTYRSDASGLEPSLGEQDHELDHSSAQNNGSTRNEEIVANLEEVMLMEAIWQSLQDSRLQRSENEWYTESSDAVLKSAMRKKATHTLSKFLTSSDEEEYSSSNSSAV